MKMATEYPDKVQAEKLIGQQIRRYKNIISDKESIIYSLSIGFTQDPLKQADFRYTSEVSQEFEAFPLLCSAAHQTDFLKALDGNPCMPKYNTNIVRHLDQRCIIMKEHYDLSLEYEHVVHVKDCIDKGKNLVIFFEINTYAEKQLVFVNQVFLIYLGLGGITYKTKNKYPQIPEMPKRKGDLELPVHFFPSQAFYYRLAGGDRNPLHIDVQEAKNLKFKQPIIHGMATFGTIARVFTQGVLDNDGSRLKIYHAKFIGHVYPGETLNLTIWKQGENKYILEAETVERKTKVLVGYIELKPAAKL